MSEASFSMDIARREGFEFEVTFDEAGWPALRLDEPPPVGQGSAPNPSRLLGAAVGSCMAASLLFCLQKSRVPVAGMRARVEGTIERNAAGRLRVGKVSVHLHPSFDGPPPDRIARCLDIFEDFCVVTQSVREGFDVEVSVHPEELAAAPEGG